MRHHHLRVSLEEGGAARVIEDVVVDEHLVSFIRCHAGHLVAQPPPLILTRCFCQEGSVWQACDEGQ